VIRPTIWPAGMGTTVGSAAAMRRRCASATSTFWSGIGSGSGAPGAAHACVQRLRSSRAGLPLKIRARTVSDEVADSSASPSAGAPVISRFSVVPSHSEPSHAPTAPSARAAAICRPLPIPPAASTGTDGPTASTISGTSTMVVISPVWPPAS
jgi:hypothetical protein